MIMQPPREAKTYGGDLRVSRAYAEAHVHVRGCRLDGVAAAAVRIGTEQRGVRASAVVA
jgi:hypothetical protein